MSIRSFALASLAAVAMMSSGTARADVIFTEIFYNLSGAEGGETEWVEITNIGGSTVDMSGWVYGDSQDGSFADPFAAGTTLAVGEVAVLVFQDEATFNSIWGGGIRVIQINPGITLANSPSPTNETVALFDATNNLVDEVNYDDENGWPSGANGESIYLLPGAFSAAANDIGTNWAVSEVGVNGGIQALIANPGINTTALDVASPGVAFSGASGVIPEPSSIVMMGLGVAGLVGMVRLRRRNA